MSEMLSAFSSPYALFAAVALSLISTGFTFYGVKQRNLPGFLLGIGTSIPTFSVLDWRFWMAGVAVCLLGLWTRTNL